MKPLYIWAGGKNKMIKKYQENLTIPLSGYDTYVEPFFGGGAMMLHIYKNNPTVQRFVMNDINEEMIGIYNAIKYDCDSFINRLNILSDRYLPLEKEQRKEFYYNLRKEYTTNWSIWNKIDESATLYFLMKTGFNGIWQTNLSSNGRFATPSGLLNQKTHVYELDNVIQWKDLLQRVDIMSGDWKTCVTSVNEKAFYFLDPPYRSCFTTYEQEFNDNQQVECIDFAKQANENGDYVMLCNRDSGDDFFTSQQGDLGLNYYDVTYTAGRRKKQTDGTHTACNATEILLFSNNIT